MQKIRGSYFLLVGVAALSLASRSVMGQGTISPDEVYSRVNNISDQLSQIYSRNLGHSANISLSKKLKESKTQPRHVFQRALDVERQMTALLIMNSLQAERTTEIAIKRYQPDDVIKIVNSINGRVSKIKFAIGIFDDRPLKKFGQKKSENIYLALNRVQKLLLRLGASATQPPDVLQRARLILALVKRLCKKFICDEIPYRPKNSISEKRPIKVYVEAYRLLAALFDVEEKMQINIKGGVFALPIESGLITPTSVNKVLGTVLADLVEINRLNNLTDPISIPPREGRGTPIEVWREVDYARRLTLNLIEKL